MSVSGDDVWQLVEQDLKSGYRSDDETLDSDDEENDDQVMQNVVQDEEDILTLCLSPDALFLTNDGYKVTDQLLLHDYCLQSEYAINDKEEQMEVYESVVDAETMVTQVAKVPQTRSRWSGAPLTVLSANNPSDVRKNGTKRNRDKEAARLAVQKTRQKVKQEEERDEAEREELLAQVRVLGEKVLSLDPAFVLNSFEREDYPPDIRSRVHDRRPEKRPEAETDAERKERTRKTNADATHRLQQRKKWDMTQRKKEIAFLRHEKHRLQSMIPSLTS